MQDQSSGANAAATPGADARQAGNTEPSPSNARAAKPRTGKHQLSPVERAIVRTAKERDNYTCRNCGVQYAPGDPLYRHIHTHHRDGDTANNGDENLITLCSRCHAFIHTPPGMQRRHHTSVNPM